MKKLLVPAGLALALTAPALADDMDRGVAIVVLFEEFCGPAFPASTVREANAHLERRFDQVMSESKRILNDLANSSTNKETAMKAWCGVMRSKIEQLRRR
jgi:hypothetical protein